VLDVGSNTVHLVVADAHRGARPAPMTSEKIELRLAEPAGGGAGGRPGACSCSTSAAVRSRWALREGVIFRRLDAIGGASATG